ncbi:Na+/H+ antiporter subunit D [Litorivicinus lipolyticus]|uniref:Na+/H+ antiporter subunit D n=1 Tax=Litorivicinus lipolyticus TaxID=418701 RepID=A0A5Q2Q8H1_9GAMM|nr:proton-conducting transporter membrane subunit [Litorivicinus lipolyticus]QGG79373.1 Na+/H+ antiporter subunit D [Litorivicinus lipolyticus]
MTLLLGPIIIPLLTATLCLLLRDSRAAMRVTSLLGTFCLAYVGAMLYLHVQENGPLSAQMGGWDGPFGITLVADLLSATLVMLTGILSLCVVIFGYSDLTFGEERNGHMVFTQVLLAGVCGAFLAGDLFNLYVWFEVMLIASFGLLVVGGKSIQIDGAVKYVGLNLIATTAMLAGIGLIYGATGGLNLAHLHLLLDGRGGEPAVLTAAALLLFAFATKSAMFPLFFWLPAAYHTPAHTTSTLFAALLTKVGIYTLLRVFTLVFDLQHPLIQSLLWISGVLTLTVGVFGAIHEVQARRVLAFLVMVSIGIMTLGMAAGDVAALKGTLLYLMQTLIVTAALFMAVGCVAYLSGTERLDEMGGLWRSHPVVGSLFVLIMLGVAGIPPTSGFWPKVLLMDAFASEQHWGLVIAVALGSLGTLYAVMRLFSAAFWQEPKAPLPELNLDFNRAAPMTALAFLVVGLGISAEFLIQVADQASQALTDPSLYIERVLGAQP